MAEDPRAAGARVLARHQLTPELAEDVSCASLVVLVDASLEPGTAGSVSRRNLSGPQASESAGSMRTTDALAIHHVDPVRLLQLAASLLGQAPPAVQVSIRALDLEVGTDLSAPVGAAMPELVDAVIDAISQHRQDHA